ncbi:MAG: creatininase family protein [Spirochaetota bacterium]
MEKILIEEMSWTEFREAMKETDLIVIPVGVIEEHGCHNPLGTDTLIAEACARLVGERAGVPVAPVLPFGYSANLVSFPGTNSLDPELYRRVLFSYAESYVRHGAKRFLFINGHGGNTGTLGLVCGELFDKYGCLCLYNQWWEVLPSLKKEWDCADHGGHFETSMMMGVDPGLVQLDRARSASVNPLTAKIEYKHGWQYGGAAIPLPVDVYKVHKYGNVGNPPFEANAELGRQMIETYVEFNVALANELKRAEFFERSLV